MTTRSGASYRAEYMSYEMAENQNTTEGLTQLVQVLLEDRQRREQEMAEERRLREEERRLREVELQQEKVRRDEETTRREAEIRQQMDLLKGLITGIHRQGEFAAEQAEKDGDVRVTKLTEEDDIEAYLTTFEWLMTAYEIPEERWAFKLAPQLVGRAQQAYAALGAQEAGEYAKLKEAILRRYDINEETYRQRFRSVARKQGETNREVVARLTDLAARWTQGCQSIEEQKDLVVLEQLLNILPEDVRIWVKERKPKSSLEAGQLADDYVQARRQEQIGKTNGPVPRRNTGERRQMEQLRCHRCKRLGHIAKNCQNKSDMQNDKEQQHQAEKPKKDLRHIECFNCHQKGHYSSKLPP